MPNILPSFYSGACLNWTTKGQTNGTCKANTITKTEAQPKTQTSYTSGSCNTITKQGKQTLISSSSKWKVTGYFSEKPQPQSTKSAKVSLSGQEDSFCLKCSLECDDLWVFCPVCKIVIHKTCILGGCVCNYKPRSWHINWMRPYLFVLFRWHFV